MVAPVGVGDMYTKIEARFWDDEKMAPLDDDCKLLGLFLLSSKYRNIVGLYILPSVYVTHRLRWPEERFQKAFAKLLEIGFIKYDTANEILFICNFLDPEYNPLENPNQVKAAIEKTNELPLSPLFEDLIAALQQHFKPFYEPLIKRLQERLQRGYAKPVTVTVEVKETVTSSLKAVTPAVDSVDNSGVSTSDNAGTTGNEGPPAGPPETVDNSGGEPQTADTADFMAFWGAYPNRLNMTQAIDAWEKVVAAGEAPRSLLIAAEAYGRHVRTKRIATADILPPHQFLTEGLYRVYVPSQQAANGGAGFG